MIHCCVIGVILGKFGSPQMAHVLSNLQMSRFLIRMVQLLCECQTIFYTGICSEELGFDNVENFEGKTQLLQV